MKKKNPPCVVSIAGTDPSGGAGIQADIKSISATGAYAASIITILVAQNTQGVQSIYRIDPDFVNDQINSVFNDLTIDAVKIGMLYNQEIIEIVISAIKTFKPKNIILDPVIVAKDGSFLLDLAALDALKKNLFPLVNLVTPNLLEAENIANRKIKSFADMEETAQALGKEFKTNILIKGGHFNDITSSDVLYSLADESLYWVRAKRIKTKNTHGTGCTLSAATASYLAQNYSLIDAIRRAKLYLTKAIRAGSMIKIGNGCGPVDHYYFL